MTRQRRKGNPILIGIACSAVFLVAGPTLAQESGAQIWGRTCNKCHLAQPVNKYTADEWKAIMAHMSLNARLTPAEEEAVTQFLMDVARPVASAESSSSLVRYESRLPDLASADPDAIGLALEGDSLDPEATYKRQCAVCHGEEGMGDGVAAAGLTPRPADLTQSTLVRDASDGELVALIADGSNTMPGFSNILSEKELHELVKLLRGFAATE